jgi:hypothetical protein
VFSKLVFKIKTNLFSVRMKDPDSKLEPIKDKYIIPNFKLYNSIDLIEEQPSLLRGEEWKFDDFFKGKKKQILLIGEPGYGKTRLLQEIVFSDNNCIYIDLKKLRGRSFDNFISGNKGYVKDSAFFKNIAKKGYFFKTNFSPTNSSELTICLDAVDEISSEHLDLFNETLVDFIDRYNECKIILSGRTHNIKNLRKFIPDDWPVVQISQFNYYQVKSLLKDQCSFLNDSEIYELIESTIMPSIDFFSFTDSILQTPRYLMLCIELLNDDNKINLANLSRFELFDVFIKQKLEKERDKLKLVDTSLINKFLSHLALLMEIKQTTSITKDEFTTVLDDISSDIKNLAFNNISLDAFFMHTLLKDNIDSIEFENREFQEYLAAKEIISWESIDQNIYDLCYIPEINIFNFSWYNVLSFIFEKYPRTIIKITQNQIIHDYAPEELLSFILANLNKGIANEIEKKERGKTFELFFKRYNNHHLPFKNGENLAYLYEGNGTDLFNILDEAHKKKNYYKIANILKLFPGLYNDRKLDVENCNWEELINNICKGNKTIEVVSQYGLPALAEFKNKNLILEYSYILDDLNEKNQPFIDAYFDALVKLGDFNLLVKSVLEFYKKTNKTYQAPINVSISIFDNAESICLLFEGFANSVETFCNFLDALGSTSSYLIEKLSGAVTSNKLLFSYAEKIILSLVEINTGYYDFLSSKFFISLCKLIGENNPELALKVIDVLKEKDFIQREQNAKLLSYLLTLANTNDCVKELKQHFDNYFLNDLFSISEKDNPEVFKLKNKYIKPIKQKHYHFKTPIDNFREKLNTSEGGYRTDVFSFYNSNYESLKSELTDDDTSRFKDLILHTLKKANPEGASISLKKSETSSKEFIIHSTVILHSLNNIAQIPDLISLVDLLPYRKTLLTYSSLNIHTENIYNLLEPIQSEEIEYLKEVFFKSEDDRNIINLRTFLSFIKRFKIVEAIPLLKEYLINQKEFHEYERIEILETIKIFEGKQEYYTQLLSEIDKDSYPNLWFKVNSMLIISFNSKDAIDIRLKEIKKRKFKFIKKPSSLSPYAIAEPISLNESELGSFEFARPLLKIDDVELIKDFLELLKFSFVLWKISPVDYEAYSKYIDDIVFNYFNNLKKTKNYEWINVLEKQIQKLRSLLKINKDYKGRLEYLQKQYIQYIEQTQPLTFFINKFNKQKSKRYLEIRSNNSLRIIIKDAIDTQLRKWVEVEGAYKMLQRYFNKSEKQTREDLMQKTLATQLENILLKKGFRKFDITRENQFLDDTRPDLVIKYGFTGTILIEIKRAYNDDFSGSEDDLKEYKGKLLGYLEKTKSQYGFFVIFNDTNEISFEEKLKENKALYKDTPIEVIGIDCIAVEN